MSEDRHLTIGSVLIRLDLFLLLGCTPSPTTAAIELDEAIGQTVTTERDAIDGLNRCEVSLDRCMGMTEYLLDVAAAEADAFQACKPVTLTPRCERATRVVVDVMERDGGAT